MRHGKKLNLINMNKVLVEFPDIDGIRQHTRIKGRCKKFGHDNYVVIYNGVNKITVWGGEFKVEKQIL